LEDRFDRANRKNLRHFIQENNHTSDSLSTINKEIEASDVGNGVDIGDVGTTEGEANNSVVLDPDAETVNRVRGLQYVSHVSYRLGEHGNVNMVAEEKRDLQRITTCAIFHKFTHGPGVPHTFVGFIRQWPALPRVVVSSILVIYNDLLMIVLDLLVCCYSASGPYFR